jgi:hypothetical protein
MNELKPCPFCGGTPILELFNDGFFDYARIRCCRVMFDWCGDETGEQAIAAWNRRVDARQLALKTRVCPMCEDCPDGCPVETPKDSRNIVTNADRIRSMSDKELAEYIFDLGNGSEYCYGHCAYQDDCATKGLDYDTCIKGVIDWLKQPAKEET